MIAGAGQTVLVDGAAIEVQSVDGTVTITVDTYDELRVLRLVVDGVLEQEVRPG